MNLSKRTSKYFLCLSLVLVLSLNAKPALSVNSKNMRPQLSLKQRVVEHQIDYISRIIQTHNKKQTSPRELAKVIVRVSNELNIDPLLTTAIIKAESTFKPYAKSNKGAMGLMQLMPGTGKYVSQIMNTNWQGIYRLHDMEYNIRLGVRYYKYLMERFHGNQVFALIAYNWGPTNTARAYKGGSNIPRTSTRYASNVSENTAAWREDYAKEFQKLFT